MGYHRAGNTRGSGGTIVFQKQVDFLVQISEKALANLDSFLAFLCELAKVVKIFTITFGKCCRKCVEIKNFVFDFSSYSRSVY